MTWIMTQAINDWCHEFMIRYLLFHIAGCACTLSAPQQIVLATTIDAARSCWYHRSCDAHRSSLNLLRRSAWTIETWMISEQQRRYSVYFALVSHHFTLFLNVLLEFAHLIYFYVFELLLIQRLLLLIAQRKAAVLELSIRVRFSCLSRRHKIKRVLGRRSL